MKIIDVYFDDHDKPLIGRTVVNDDNVDEVVEILTREGGESYKVEVTDPESVDDIIKELRNLLADD